MDHMIERHAQMLPTYTKHAEILFWPSGGMLSHF